MVRDKIDLKHLSAEAKNILLIEDYCLDEDFSNEGYTDCDGEELTELQQVTKDLTLEVGLMEDCDADQHDIYIALLDTLGLSKCVGHRLIDADIEDHYTKIQVVFLGKDDRYYATTYYNRMWYNNSRVDRIEFLNKVEQYATFEYR